MIRTVMYCSWLNLRRDKVALGLAFVLPVAFFSIFAAIFGGMGGGDGASARPITVALVDQDQTEFSAAFIEGIAAQPSLKLLRGTKDAAGVDQAFTTDTAERAVRTGDAATAVILLPDLQNHVGFGPGSTPAVRLIYDPSNPMARHTVRGLLQSVGMNTSPTAMMDQGMEMLQRFGGPLTPQQEAAVASFKQMQGGGGAASTGGDPVPVEAVSLHEEEGAGKGPDLISYYAAGIGVMFLLFAMSGAGGGLLEEDESGTLDRLMISQLGMRRLILGKWLFFTCLGLSQLVVMFCWGALVFGLDLFTLKHFSGFVLMTVPVCCAGAAFGLLLATLARSRGQLSGMSTIIILVMSALGGSMVPRFVMPAYMDTVAKFTLNGQAIDGYLKIFWREDPTHTLPQALATLLPQVGVLSAMAAVMLLAALTLAKRWKAV